MEIVSSTLDQIAKDHVVVDKNHNAMDKNHITIDRDQNAMKNPKPDPKS